MLWFYSFFPITDLFSVSIVTMHICWNLFNLLLSFQTLNRKWSFKNCLHINAALTSHFVLICFCLCCVFFFFFFQKTRGSSFFFPLVKCCVQTVTKKTLYYLMINMYDIQEPYLTLLLCKVYLLCLLLCFFSHEHLSGKWN